MLLVPGMGDGCPSAQGRHSEWNGGGKEEFLGLLSMYDVEWPLIKYQVAELMG